MIQGTSKPSLILKRLPVIRMATVTFPPSPKTGSVAAGQSGPGQARRAGTSPPPKSPSSRAQGGPGQQRRRGAEAWGYLRLEGSSGGLGGRSAAGEGGVAAERCPYAGPQRRQPGCGGR